MKSIIMKNVLALMSILLSSSAALADNLYIEPFTIRPGETKDVSIYLINSQSVTALQADIYISEGLELIKQGDEWMTLSSRASSDHNLIVNYDGGEWTRLICFSSTNTPFTESEGTLINMKIRATENFVNGSIGLTNIKLSDLFNQDLLLDDCWINVDGLIPADNIVMSNDAVELRVGENFLLYATVYPDYTTDKTITWTSDNVSVATVDENGSITAISLGTATITACCGNVSASCAVNVVATPVESIILSQNEAQLKVGESFALTAYVYPEDATDKTVEWTSDNEAVATVDENGTVTAVSLGSAVISATCGNVSVSCVVTVVATMVESITLSPDSWNGTEGESFKIEATVMPEEATDKTLEWTSSDESVACVDNEGNVSLLKEGTCIVTVTSVDGSGIYAECIITSVSGVDSLFSAEENIDVYGLNGILIKKSVNRDFLKILKSGVYIIRKERELKKLIIR